VNFFSVNFVEPRINHCYNSQPYINFEPGPEDIIRMAKQRPDCTVMVNIGPERDTIVILSDQAKIDFGVHPEGKVQFTGVPRETS